MKQVVVQVRTEQVGDVVALGHEHGAAEPSHHPVTVGGRDGWTRLLVNMPNERIGGFIDAVGDRMDDVEFVIPTTESVPLRTPIGDVRDRVTDVSRRSTLELVLEVMQSLGTWTGMLLYSAVSGLVAAYGVIFGVPFLLTAAMLIAPVGAPAMVAVMGVTMGDTWMLRRGSIRFLVAVAVLAAAGAALGLLYDLEQSTAMMETLTNLSAWSALLGVAGGTAGAQAQVQAERDSLVTATATGFLVAVSLSPPAAVLGLSVAIGRWDYVALMAFLLALTFAGILTGGSLSLRLQGLGPRQMSASRGRRRTQRLLGGLGVVLLGALIAWQVAQGPGFRKADLVRSAERATREAVSTVPGYRVLAANASFTTADAQWHEGEGLLIRLVVTETGEGGTAQLEGEAVRETLRSVVRERVLAAMDNVQPFVNVSVIPR